LEQLGMREQAMLSCGHLFHRACIDSFERFQASQAVSHGRRAAALGTRKCPLCRAEGYEKRRTRLGAEAHVQGCVVRIQALWRGARTRTAFRRLRRAFYDGGGGAGSSARRLFFLGEMADVSRRVRSAVAEAERRSQARVSRLLGEADLAREAMNTALRAAGLPVDDGGASSDEEEAGAADRGRGGSRWKALRATAAGRVGPEDDCPICLQALLRPGGGEIALLSCGHALHLTCVRSFERFQSDAAKERACPVCRAAGYRRRVWDPEAVEVASTDPPVAAPVGRAEQAARPSFLAEDAAGTAAQDAAQPGEAAAELEAAILARQARNDRLTSMLGDLTSKLNRLGGDG